MSETHSAIHTEAVDAAIGTRRSVRAVLPTPVPREVVEDILRVAARALSGTNAQPWKVSVLTGEAKTALSTKIRAVLDEPVALARHPEEYACYPTEWRSPYLERRRKVGRDLYTLLVIGKSEKGGMHRQHGRNCEFFEVPVGLMFTIDREPRQGNWLDYGMFLQSVMVVARGRGLDTCPQAAFTRSVNRWWPSPASCHEPRGCLMSAPGRSQTLTPQHAARRVVK